MNRLNIDLICEMFKEKPKNIHKQFGKLYEVASEHWKQVEEAILGLCEENEHLRKEIEDLKNLWHETNDAIPEDLRWCYAYTKENTTVIARYDFDRDKWVTNTSNQYGGIEILDKYFVIRWKYKQ